MLKLDRQGEFIDSTMHVKKRLKEEKQIEYKEHLIRDVMRRDLGMKYKKVKPVPLQANSVRNLILRQQFALAFFKIDLNKKTVINIDETWLGMSDFRRRKWAQPLSTNSVAQLQMTPRVSMIAALDSNGALFLSLLQANNNSSVMALFLNQLVQRLDQERPGWCKSHVVLWDNAPYHKSGETLQLLEELQVPIIFTGPHSK